MVLDANGNTNVQKTNAYRLGVNQYRIAQAQDASTLTYCVNMYIATARIFADSVFTKQAPSPTPDAANLFAFLAMRFNAAVGILGCPVLLGFPSPLSLITAQAAAEHLAKFPREEIAKFKTLTVTVDATFSQSIVDKVSQLQPDAEPAAFAVGESAVVAPAATAEAAASTSYLIPLIAVSTVLGGIAAATTTVVVVKKVRERRAKKELAISIAAHGSKQLTPTPQYTTDISNGYPIPLSPRNSIAKKSDSLNSPNGDSPRPNSPSPRNVNIAESHQV